MRKLMRLIVLLLCACLLSSCSGKEFKFDEAISWHSTIENIEAKYGTQYSESEKIMPQKNDNYNSKQIKYTNFNCCGFDNFNLYFYVNEQEKDISLISVAYSDLSSKEMNDSIISALISKYGEPSDTTENYLGGEGLYAMEWLSAVKETRVLLVYGEGKRTNIKYYNTKYYSPEGEIETSRKMLQPQTNGI